MSGRRNDGYWGLKTFCVVTGASRGIGKAIAIEFSRHVAPGSTFLLLARTTAALQDTKREITAAASDQIAVHLLGMDLTHPNKERFSSELHRARAGASFQHAIIVHCAGILGNVKQTVLQTDNLLEIQNFFNLEVASVLILSAEFFKSFPTAQRSIVAMSSECSLEPFRTYGLYCAGKAARETYLKRIAMEEKGKVQVINYAPGEVDTDMYEEGCRETGDPEVRQKLIEEKARGIIPKPQVVVKKLVEILRSGKYTRGEHVMFEDEI